MDITKILKSFNVEEDKIESIKDSINKELGKDFIPRNQYNKKIKTLDEVEEQYNDLKAKLENTNLNEYKEKYETLQNEFNTYKNNIEVEKTNSSKRDILKAKLEKEGVNTKLIPLLAKEFDLNNLEIKDNNIDKWEEVLKPIKESYSDFFTTVNVEGHNPMANTNNGGSSAKFTKEQIQAMTHEQIIQNYDAIKESLPNIK